MSKPILSIEKFADRVILARKHVHAMAIQRAENQRKPDKTVREGLKDFPSDLAVKRLLVASFYASLELDESRPCKFCLSWDHGAFGKSYIAKFDPAIPLTDPTILAKLAHATADESAMVLAVAENELSLSGINYRYSRLHSGNESSAGIRVFVRGPGVIEYSEINYSTAYHRGKQIRIRPFWSVPIVAGFIEGLEKRQVKRAYDLLKDSRKRSPSPPHSDDHCTKAAEASKISGQSLLRDILNSIKAQSHGGTLAIAKIRRGVLESRYHKCTGGLKWQMDDHVYGQSLRETYFNEHRFLFDSMLTPSRVVHIEQFLQLTGKLAGIDGILLLDEDLEVCEIGAIVPGVSQDKSKCRMIDLRGQELPSDVMQHRGTRHRAAIRLCELADEAIVFVISQDGDLRLFAKQGDDVLFVDNLSTW